MQAVCSSRNAALLQLTLRIVRKLLWMLLVLWGITLISFWVIHLAPGSPTDMETTLNPLAGEAARQRLEALYGLDKPLHVQYLDWLSRLVRLDFGLSMSADGRPVLDKIMERLPLTVGMNVISLILTFIAVAIQILNNPALCLRTGIIACDINNIPHRVYFFMDTARLAAAATSLAVSP